MEYFSYLFDPIYSRHIWIYNGIIISVCLFAFISNYAKHKREKAFWFALSFLVAWFFFAFTNSGTDWTSYINIYNESSLTSEYFASDGLEIGYGFLNAFLHLFIKNANYGIVIIKTIQIALVFSSIYSLKSEIHLGFSVLAYMALFYFPAFNILRISLAGAICLFSYIKSSREKYLISFFLGIVSVFIHKAAAIFIIALSIYNIYRFSGRYKTLLKALILFAVPFIVFWGKDILMFVLQTGFFFDRYENYLGYDSTFGFMQIIFYLPILFVYFAIPISQKKLFSYDLIFCFIVIGFAVAMLGYSVGMLSRMAVFFVAPFMFFLPQYIKSSSSPPSASSSSQAQTSLGLRFVIFLYWCFRYIIVMSDIFLISGLYNFSFFF